MMLYATPECADLARALIRRLPGAVAGRLVASRFKDGEPAVTLRDLPRGHAALIASTGPGETRFVNALFALDALKSNKAKRTTLVIPYAGFARQDDPAAGNGVAARLAGRALRAAGAHRMIVLDPHSTTFVKSVPNVVTVSAVGTLAGALTSYAKNAVVAAPDRGARLRAMQLAGILGGLPTAYVEKKRTAPDTVSSRALRGAKVSGKTVILIDDIIDTAGTMLGAIRLLKQRGATRVVAAATHGLFTGTALRDLQKVCEAVVVTDSLPKKEEKGLRVVECAPVLAKALRAHA